jgi:hypothetical protein
MLVANQVALSLAMLILAGLSIQTFRSLARTPIGFEGRGVLVARIDSDDFTEPGLAKRLVALARRARAALGAMPEIERVGASFATPLGGMVGSDAYFCAGQPEPATTAVHVNFVSPDWFATYRTGFFAGRDFSERDAAGAPGVAIVNTGPTRSWPRAAAWRPSRRST